MKKLILAIAIFALMAGCTKYASQEQLDELQARKEAVAALKSDVKDAQKEKVNLMDEKRVKEERIAELKEGISELEEKLR